MAIVELRDSAAAREHLLTGLWLSRAIAPGAESVAATLDLALEITSDGGAVPPLGFLADLGHVALGSLHPHTADGLPSVPGFDPILARRYEDYVLGKLYADLSFERGADALLRYQGRDRVKGLAFLARRLEDRTGVGGVVLSPAVIKPLQQMSGSDALAEGWQLAQRNGLSPLLLRQYEELVEAVRGTGELLGADDVFELEHGTALAGFGQRVALRQVLAAARELAADLPEQKPKAQPRRQQVATRILDEDAYPVGGFSSISTRGSIESLLHSQLAYLERDDRPDLFDVKYVRDELLYYSRDENLFLRRRRVVVFALDADLVAARCKDRELPWQRIVLALGLVLAAVERLTQWLSQDALQFQVLFLRRENKPLLDDEETLLATLFRTQIESGLVTIASIPRGDLARCRQHEARRAMCQCLLLSASDEPIARGETPFFRLVVDGPNPGLACDVEPVEPPETAGLAGWRNSADTFAGVAMI